MKQYLKIASGNIKSLSTTLNIQMIQDYQSDFGKSRIAMENQKLHEKFSEYVFLTVQTVSAAFFI